MNNFTGEPGDCKLNQSPIRQHFDVVQSGGYQKNCPMQMRWTTSTGNFTRDNGDMWKYYVSYVQRYWKEINGGGTTTITTEEPNKVTDVKIPEYIKVNGTTCKVTGIAAKAFNGKTNLTRVAIPSTISWGNLSECFSGSTKLQAINVAKGNTYVSSNAGKLVYDGATITPAGYNAGSAQNVASGVTPKDTASSTSSSAIGDKDYVALMSAFRTVSGSKVSVDVNKKLMKNVAASTSVSALRAQFEDSTNMTFKDTDNNSISETSLIGTGATISDIDRTGATISVTLVVKADVDGDGRVAINDYTLLKSAFKKKINLTGVFSEAADVNGDGQFTITDYITIKRQANGTYNLYK